MELRLHAVENDASAIEQSYNPKQKQLLKFKFDCNPSVVCIHKLFIGILNEPHDLRPDDPKN